MAADYLRFHSVASILYVDFYFLLLSYYLNCLLARVSIPDKFVSQDLDVIDLLLPQLQLSHETLKNTNKTVNERKIMSIPLIHSSKRG